MRLGGYEVYALGGSIAGKRVNTGQVYDIGADIGHGNGLSVLAHPSHMPRV